MAAAVLPLLACSSGPADGALKVVVKFGAASATKCVIVQVRSGGTKVSTAALNRKTKPELVVGVKKSVELSGTVQLQAMGYSAEGCTEGAQVESSAVESADLDALGVTTVVLRLDPSDPGDGGMDVDQDSDTYKKSVDCDDTNPAINPGVAEKCSNGLDDNCDLALDCADPKCGGASCNDNDACSAIDVCMNGVCVGTQVMACTSTNPCELSPGLCSAGACQFAVNVGAVCPTGFCRADKTCALGEVNCANGVDDDNDGGADCADSACADQACDAGVLLCHSGATCQAGQCAPLASSVKTCTAPAGGCFTGGACQADAGCVFTQLDAGATCPGGSCRADAGCGPVEAGALCANGLDDDGDGLTDCSDPSCNASACDDGMSCTKGTVCVGLACGGGMGQVCPAAPACSVTSMCLADGGCVFAAGPAGVACGDGGTCTPSGACAFDAGVSDAGGFPYVPSNFNPAAIPAVQIMGDVRFTNCTAVFDATTGLWPQTCLQFVPLPFSVTQPGGEQVWVLAMRSLTIDANAALRLQGNRPVILAIYGGADFSGPVSARSTQSGAGSGLGAGGNWSGCAAAGLLGTNGGLRSGFGAGGGGAAFATDGGNSVTSMTAVGGVGGVGKADSLVPLHGGCKGGTGGGATAAAGGAGGGAVQVSVSGTLKVSSWISASGGGGREGGTNTGGGGAGSGGAVFLEASAIDLAATARLTCNGGGGAEGGGANDPGANGVDGSANSATPAPGGPFMTLNNTNGGNGGNGAAGAIAAEPGELNNNSSGGGGGGLGHIRLRAINACVTTGAVLSGIVSRSPNCPP